MARSLVPKYFLTTSAYTIGVVLLFLSFIPLSVKTLIQLGFGIDKFAHTSVYFIFSLVLDLALSIDWQINKSEKKTVIVAFFYGLMIEVIQGIGLIFRSFELNDLLANSIGILFFLVLGKTIKKIVVKSGIFIN